MDLTQISDADLEAYASGNLQNVSMEALEAIFAAEQQANLTTGIRERVTENLNPDYAEGSPPVFDSDDPEIMRGGVPSESNYAGEGFKNALRRTGIGSGQLLNEVLGNFGLGSDRLPNVEDARALHAEEQKYAMTPSQYPGYKTGDFAGTMATGLPMFAATKNPAVFATGAGLGFVQPTLEEGDLKTRAANAALYGASGVFGNMAGRGITNAGRYLMNPSKAPGVNRLNARGVQTTPGQTRGGLWKSFEDLAESFPILGPAITGARRDGIEQFGTATLNRVLQPLGKTTEKTGQAGVRDASRIISNAYDEVYDDLVPNVRYDQIMADEWTAIAKDVARYGNKESVDEFKKILARYFHDPIDGTGGVIPGRLWGDLQKDLRNHGFTLQGAGKYDLGENVINLSDAMNRMTARVSPEAGELLANANRAHQRLRPVRNASVASGVNDGVFTPAQLIRGTGKDDKTKLRYSQGRMPLQGWGSTGQRVLPSTTGNSGTTDRALLANLLNPGTAALGVGVAGGSTLLGGDPVYNTLGTLGALTLGRGAYRPGLMNRINAMRNRPGWMRRAGAGFRAPPGLMSAGGVGLGASNLRMQ